MKTQFLFLALLFALSKTTFSQITNENFESSIPGVYTGSSMSVAISGWTISNQAANSCTLSNVWTGGSTKMSVMSTPLSMPSSLGTLTHSPLGGTVVAVLNGITVAANSTRIMQIFTVTTTNYIFNYAWAAVLQDGGHACCQAAQLAVIVRTQNGQQVPCLSEVVNTGTCGSGQYFSYSNNFYYNSWQTKFLNLSPYIGTAVSIEVIASDCNTAGHYGVMYFDAQCSTSPIICNCSAPTNSSSVQYCAGAPQAMINGPAGMSSYTWVTSSSNSLAPSQSSLASITVTNPVPGQQYTVAMTSTAGCLSMMIYTLVTTTISIPSTSTSAGCNNGPSGSATVFPAGSGNGYNYTWNNASGSVVATSSTAASLLPGNYTVMVSAQPGCGTVMAQVNVATNNFSFSLPPNNIIGACSGSFTNAILALNIPTTSIAQSFSWSPATFLSSTNSTSVSITPTAPPGGTSTIIYTITNTPSQVGCIVTQTIQLNIGPVITPTITPIAPICKNLAGVQINATPGGGTFTSISNPALSAGGIVTPSNNALGLHTFTYYLNNGGCVTFTNSTYQVAPTPTIVVSGLTSVCSGGSAVLNVSGANVYSWSPAGGTQSSQTVTPGATTVYSVTGTFSNTGCNSTTQHTLVVLANPTIQVTGQTVICPGQSATLQAGGASTYTWSDSSNNPTIVHIPSASNPTIGVVGTAANNCTSVKSVMFSFVPNPTLNILGNPIVCAGSLLTLTVTGANSYTWNNVTTGSTYTDIPTQGSLITVAGTNSGICTSSLTFNVFASKCTGIEENSANTNLVASPSPFGSSLNIQLAEKGVVHICDLNGRIVFSASFEAGLHNIPTADFAKGIYIVKYSGKNTGTAIKILKE